MKKMKLSPFVHFVPLDRRRCAVYNSLNLTKFFCDESQVESIKKQTGLEGRLLSYLKNKRFIIDDGISEEDEIRRVLNRNKVSFGRPEFRVFYFIVTTACNFRCKYCYLSSFVEHTGRYMSRKTAKETLEFFQPYMKKVTKERPRVVLYGGEPLLNWDISKFIIESIRDMEREKRIPRTNVILITNGSLMDEEKAKFLRRNRVLSAISIDGPEEINDSNRVYSDGRGTYKDTVKALEIMKGAGLRPTISCTINEKNVNHLRNIIKWFAEDFEVDSLGLNLFAGGDCSTKTVRNLSKDTAKQIIEAFKICREYGIYEDTVLRQMKSFVKEIPTFYYCAATGREVSIDPDGNLATCPAFLGTEMFDDVNITDKPDLEKHHEFINWTRRTPFLQKDCLDCIALGLCGGGCAFNAHKNHGDIHCKDDFFCNYAKGVTEWMLKDLDRIIRLKKPKSN